MLLFLNDFFFFAGSGWNAVNRLLLAWGARGREFESRHADHSNERVTDHKSVTRFYFPAQESS